MLERTVEIMRCIPAQRCSMVKRRWLSKAWATKQTYVARMPEDKDRMERWAEHFRERQ